MTYTYMVEKYFFRKIETVI